VNIPTASAVTWSMTSQGVKPFRLKPGMILPVRRECQHCGVEFVTQSRKARFCTANCSNNNRRQKGRTPKPCKNCGQPFIKVWPHDCYCSDACRPKRERLKRKRRSYPKDAASGPDKLDKAANWCNNAPWASVETSWVPLFLDLYATDDNRTEMLRMLLHVRSRYRAATLSPELSRTG
jgi:hypothetical protein